MGIADSCGYLILPLFNASVRIVVVSFTELYGLTTKDCVLIPHVGV